MQHKDPIAELLVEAGAVKMSVNEPFTWASGWKSPIYCDNRLLLSNPVHRNTVKQALADSIRLNFPDVQLIAGVATAGIAWGALVAEALGINFIYVRPKPKEHGLGNQIEGSYATAERTVIIEDLVSTGKSSLQVADVLLTAGLNIKGMQSIFTYGFKEAEQAFNEKGILLLSLTNYERVVQLWLKDRAENPDTLKSLLNWQAAPDQWSNKA